MILILTHFDTHSRFDTFKYPWNSSQKFRLIVLFFWRHYTDISDNTYRHVTQVADAQWRFTDRQTNRQNVHTKTLCSEPRHLPQNQIIRKSRQKPSTLDFSKTVLERLCLCNENNIINNIYLKFPDFSSILCDFPWLFQSVKNDRPTFPHDWKITSYFSSPSGNPDVRISIQILISITAV